MIWICFRYLKASFIRQRRMDYDKRKTEVFNLVGLKKRFAA